MIIGLDLGSTEFRSIRQEGHRLIVRKVPAVYCITRDESAQRRLLEQTGIPYSQADGALLVLGSSAFEFSQLMHCPLIPVIMNGDLPWQDPVGRQVCTALVESVLPHSSGKSFAGQNQTCVLTLPPAVAKRNFEQDHFLSQILTLKGFQTKVMNQASAVVLSELQNYEFSGVSVVVGAESVSISLCQYGKPIFEGFFGHGFQAIKDRFASTRHRYLWDTQGNRYLDVQGVESWLQTGNISLSAPKSGDELWLAERCSQLMSDARNALLPELIRFTKPASFTRPIPLIVGGGAANIEGFSSLVQQSLQARGLSLKIGETLRATQKALSVARGLFIHGVLEHAPHDPATRQVA